MRLLLRGAVRSTIFDGTHKNRSGGSGEAVRDSASPLAANTKTWPRGRLYTLTKLPVTCYYLATERPQSLSSRALSEASNPSKIMETAKLPEPSMDDLHQDMHNDMNPDP